MREIQLTQGLVVQVDDEDYNFLNKYKWQAVKCNSKYYAKRIDGFKNGKRKFMYLHREIMKTPNNLIVDHKDRNGLNCQKSNMRNCTYSENRMNSVGSGKSKFHGVSYNRKSITAQIKVNGKIYHLGIFKTEELAAKEYDKAARLYHGEFANLNFKENEIPINFC